MYSRSKNLKGILLVILGASILAFGTYNFNYQNGVTEGGVLGLLLLFKNIFDISPSVTNLVIDFSLFALGARFFGKKFLLFSIFSTACFSFSYNTFESIGFIVPNLTEHMLLVSIFAGLFVGVGVGLVLRGGGASGGDDVIALLVSKFTPLKVNHVYFLTDAIVLVLSLVYLRFDQVIYSILAVTISGKLIEVIYEYNKNSNEGENLEKAKKEKLKTKKSITA